MCLIAFALGAHPRFPLVLAANRDEFYRRASAAAGWWSDAPHVFAGRDLEAGGTWLGLTRDGRVAALTNVRRGVPDKAGKRSRGELVGGYLQAERIEAASYARSIDGERYAGFNLLLMGLDGTAQARWLSNRDPEAQASGRVLDTGLHGLSNGLLDSPWPKLAGLKRALADALREDSAAMLEARLFAALADRTIPPDDALPDTGVGLERERSLAPAFISADGYGTRCSTVLTVDREGQATFTERSWPPPDSPRTGWLERRTRFRIRPAR